MNVLGKKVIHDKYGVGTIECVWNGEITIRFDSSMMNQKFNLAEEINHFTFETPELKKQVIAETIRRLEKDLTNLSIPDSKYLIHARTHALFINTVFNQNLKGLLKCTWNYSDNILVWIVRFHDEKEEWQNRFLDNNTILQHYTGNEKRKFYHSGSYPQAYRLVVSVDDSDYADRIYRIEGLFRLVREKCSPRDVYFERVSDESAHLLMPKLF